MHAKSVMSSPVITARPEATVTEIANTLLDNHISAVPIVAEDGKLEGIISEGDLIRRSEIGTGRRRSWWLNALAGTAMAAEDFIKSHGTRAGDLMSVSVVTIQEDTPLWEIAELLEKRKIKRVPVMKDGKVVGIVSRANLLHALTLQRDAATPAPSGDDEELRERIMIVLASESWPDTAHLNVVVKDGTVYLWGAVKSRLQSKALRVAAESVPGVKAVEDKTAVIETLYGTV